MDDIKTQAHNTVMALTPKVCASINQFSADGFKTRGGRLGSGMGLLLEAMWGYHMNQELENLNSSGNAVEIAWLPDNEYNDFACVFQDRDWFPNNRTGELFRIEAKSMNLSADESKAHFDELKKNFTGNDLLLVLVWKWEELDKQRVYPRIVDSFVGQATIIAELRDALHIARGGSFVDSKKCPDGCDVKTCTHDGEPLNAAGKRERLSGPNSLRPSANVSFAANFGGLIRMLKTNSADARKVFREVRKNNEVAHQYISFIHRNLPSEEKNQYLTNEWRILAQKLGIKSDLEIEELLSQIRSKENYQEMLRELD
ncbi:MAG: hypothetical protein COV10_01900 [Candidatus Vogelbacteria bacterium CG10_big_fil_rev_8_21_14_0_10_51_16]|uniref:Uncharacterized protein n=1 Tax=Candidatus Vogelbacteria bacterium CG10_big_fil_rev_8_21_14_0_10_51_16 TaxID=1975045 RepID=A0A2H0REH0_9BACT|nr:MAG: hypothetical protein COV10_01900 [Candidatus Vogelbacteria bacterium CG10_big_fil_rev_8_21_14_0_10_51_16]